jgi:hypothetical protein
MDVAAARYGWPGVQVHWQKEAQATTQHDAQFTTRQVHLGFEPHSTTIGDFDGDKDLDIALIDGETDVIILENRGRGSPTTKKQEYTIRDSLELIAIRAADLDGDGHSDLACADEATDYVQVMRNEGGGTFRQLPSYRAGDRPVRAHDRRPRRRPSPRSDLREHGLELALALSRARGTAPSARARPCRVGASPRRCGRGDFDGRREDRPGGRVLRLLGGRDLYSAGEGLSFTRKGRVPVGLAVPPASPWISTGSRPSISRRRTSRRAASCVFLGRAGRPPARGHVRLDGTDLHARPGDWDGDGAMDLAGASPSAGALVNAPQHGEGGLLAGPPSTPAGSEPRFAVAGDMDGDGDRGHLASNHTSLDFTFLWNETARKPAAAGYLKAIATEAEMGSISSRGEGPRRPGALAKYVAPADPKDASALARRVPGLEGARAARAVPSRPRSPSGSRPHAAGLRPPHGAPRDAEVLGRRASGRADAEGPLYGFSVLADFLDDPGEMPRVEEVRAVFENA